MSLNKDSLSNLSIVIAFKNEKQEVYNTLKSLVLHLYYKNTPIILIDDCSNDKYDYVNIAKAFNAEYYKSNIPLGSAGGKMLGVSKVKTKYFCLFDAHMRMYNNDWDLELLHYLENNPNNIYTSNSVIMTKVGNTDNIINENLINRNKTFGAFARVDKGWEYHARWCNKFISETDDLGLVPLVLGAVYATSKEHWDYIHGFEGLEIYGIEEPLMSIKTFLTGNYCYLIKDFYVGHLYRKSGEQPFTITPTHVDANQLTVAFLFENFNDFNKILENLKNRTGPKLGNLAEEELKIRIPKLLKYKEYIKSISKKTIKDFFEFQSCVVNEIKD